MDSDYYKMQNDEERGPTQEINCASERSELTHNNNNTQVDQMQEDLDSDVMKFYEYEDHCFPFIDSESGDSIAIEQSVWYFAGDSKKDRQEWTLRIERDQIMLTLAKNENTKIKVPWENLLGAKTKITVREKSHMAEVVIYLMKPTRVGCLGTLNRDVSELIFTLETMPHAKLVAALIANFARKQNYLQAAKAHLVEQKIPIFEHKLLVFLNPVGGDGSSPAKWAIASQLLDKAGYKHLLVQTKYRNHAFDYVSEMPLSELLTYRGIVTLSGDGIPHEILNGITSRKDKEQVLKRIALGALPAGSGNGLINSILKECGEPLTLEAATYLVCKGKMKNIDLMEMQTTNTPKITSFLSLAWAYIADVDLNSEFLRCVGGLRFDIMGTYRALFQKAYEGMLWTTEEHIYELPGLNEDITDQHWTQEQATSFKYFMAMNTPMITQKDLNAPNAKLDDGFIDLQYISSAEGWSALLKYALKFQSGSHFDQKTQQKTKGMKFTYKRVKAFRLAARNRENDLGLLSVDGERYEGGVIQGRILPGILKVFSL